MRTQIVETYFYDKLNERQNVTIYTRPNIFVTIKSTNEKNEPTGYVNLYFHDNNRIYLSEVYCYDQFRNRNIASSLMKIADEYLSYKEEYIIRGDYNPTQLSTDRENGIMRTEKKLDEAARNFYESVGFQIVSLEEYNKNPDLYNEITLKDDFMLGEDYSDIIVYKKINNQKVKLITY